MADCRFSQTSSTAFSRKDKRKAVSGKKGHPVPLSRTARAGNAERAPRVCFRTLLCADEGAVQRAPRLRRLLHDVRNLAHELCHWNRLVVLPVVHLCDLASLLGGRATLEYMCTLSKQREKLLPPSERRHERALVRDQTHLGDKYSAVRPHPRVHRPNVGRKKRNLQKQGRPRDVLSALATRKQTTHLEQGATCSKFYRLDCCQRQLRANFNTRGLYFTATRLGRQLGDL